MSILYSFDSDGIYTGTTEPILDKKESRKQGISMYLIPANTTPTAPSGTVGEWQKYQWNGVTWDIVYDYRRQIIHEQVEPYGMQEVTELGPLPAGWALTPAA